MPSSTTSVRPSARSRPRAPSMRGQLGGGILGQMRSSPGSRDLGLRCPRRRRRATRRAQRSRATASSATSRSKADIDAVLSCGVSGYMPERRVDATLVLRPSRRPRWARSRPLARLHAARPSRRRPPPAPADDRRQRERLSPRNSGGEHDRADRFDVRQDRGVVGAHAPQAAQEDEAGECGVNDAERDERGVGPVALSARLRAGRRRPRRAAARSTPPCTRRASARRSRSRAGSSSSAAAAWRR